MIAADDAFHAFMPYPPAPVAHATHGPLTGLTVAVKDIFDVVNYPTGCGNPTMLAMSGIKARTASFPQMFLDAGARFVGKTHTVELAFALTGLNNHFGTPINPAAKDRLPGGSSSGSASATAGRLCDIGIGSDTGGSVRGPASYCGLFGIRPTHGRLPLDCTMPLASSFDTPGWFSRDGAQFERVADAIYRDDPNPLPKKIRLIAAEDCFEQADKASQKPFNALLSRIDRMMQPFASSRVADDFDPLYWAFRWLQGHEAWAAQGDFITKMRPELMPAVAARFMAGKEVTKTQVKTANTTRAEFRKKLADILGDDGVIVLPTVPGPAPKISEPDHALEDVRMRSLKLLCLSGLSGFPQVQIPAGFVDGAPIGLSVLGPHGSDLSLIKLAVKLSKAMAVKIA